MGCAMKYLGSYDLFVDEDGVVYRECHENRKDRCKGGLYPMKTYTDKNGYLYVQWNDKKKHYCQKVHRLVALAFIPNPNGYETVDHKDRNPLNNHLSNLRWADRKMQSNNRDCVEASISLYGVRCCENPNDYKKAWRKARKQVGKRYV